MRPQSRPSTKKLEFKLFNVPVIENLDLQCHKSPRYEVTDSESYEYVDR